MDAADGQRLPARPIIGRIGLDFCRSKPHARSTRRSRSAPSGGTGAGVNDGRHAHGAAAGGASGAAVAPAGGAAQAARRRIRTKSGVWRSDDGGKTVAVS